MRKTILALCLVVVGAIAHAGAVTDSSGTVATANTSQQVMPARQNRTYLFCQNPVGAAETLFVNFEVAASTTAGSYEIAPGGSITFSGAFVPTGIVSVTATAAGKRFICKQGT